MTEGATRTAAEILASVEAGVARRRAADLAELHDVLEWCAVHTVDPRTQPGFVPVVGADRLVDYGGDGTPQVAELGAAELAVARQAGFVATRNLMADALDLAHRLTLTWAAAQDGRCEVWVLRQVARMSRRLTRVQVRVVDAAVSAALHASPARILGIAEAKVIEADPEAHQKRIDDNLARRGVWLSERRPGDQVDDDGEPGVRGIYGRLEEGDAVAFDRAIDEVADLLAEEYADRAAPGEPVPGRDELRAEAMALLSDPHAAAAFLDRDPTANDEPAPADDDPAPADDDDPAPAEVEERALRASRSGAGGERQRPTPDRSPRRRKAVIFLHLHEDVLDGSAHGIARVEGLGPMLPSQLRSLLGEACDVEVTPVVDLHRGRAVNAYEHPTDVKDRTELRTAGDVSPHSAHTTDRGGPLDHDHPVPYERDGPPGQTGDHNDAPLTRRYHRAKTHLGYQVVQTGPGEYLWRTPHGLRRLVTPDGTHTLTPLEADFYAIVHRIELSPDYPTPT